MRSFLKRLILWLAICGYGLFSSVAHAVTAVDLKLAQDQRLLQEDLGVQYFSQWSKKGYEQSEKVFQSLGQIPCTEKPLALCELASVQLLLGKKIQAAKSLKEAIGSLESHLNPTSADKQNLGIWTSERVLTYAGEPYEQSTLYLLMGMCLLEQNDVRGARAYFQKAISADRGPQNGSKPDFGLPYILEAKCNEILGNKPQRDALLKESVLAAFRCPSGNEPLLKSYLKNIDSATLQQIKSGEDRLSFNDQLLLSWLGMDSPEVSSLYPECRSYLKSILPQRKEMDFNTVVMLWNGTGPSMFREGENGSIRVINPGSMILEPTSKKPLNFCLYQPKQGTLPFGPAPFQWYWGYLSYQAITNGTTSFERVNQSMAMVQKNHRITSTAPQMDEQADTRCWRCLPADFQPLFVKLPPGRNKLFLSGEVGGKVYLLRTLTVDVKEDAPVNVFHVNPMQVDLPATFQGYSLAEYHTEDGALCPFTPTVAEVPSKKTVSTKATPAPKKIASTNTNDSASQMEYMPKTLPASGPSEDIAILGNSPKSEDAEEYFLAGQWKGLKKTVAMDASTRQEKEIVVEFTYEFSQQGDYSLIRVDKRTLQKNTLQGKWRIQDGALVLSSNNLECAFVVRWFDENDIEIVPQNLDQYGNFLMIQSPQAKSVQAWSDENGYIFTKLQFALPSGTGEVEKIFGTIEGRMLLTRQFGN